jgi:hypothetical protein
VGFGKGRGQFVAAPVPGVQPATAGRRPHAVGAHGLAPAEVAPAETCGRILQEIEQRLVVVAPEEAAFDAAAAARRQQDVDDPARVRSAVDIVAKTDQHRPLGAGEARIGEDGVEQRTQQIAAAVHVADGVGDDARRDRRRRGGRSRAEQAFEEGCRRHQAIMAASPVRRHLSARTAARRSGWCRPERPAECWSGCTRAHWCPTRA